MYLGDYIAIEEQLDRFTFACESVSTGTPFIAEVDEDKREIFLDFTFPKRHSTACRFLRPDGDLLRCTIHRDSPTQCKFYRCVVMKIYDRSENRIGTVTGTLSLHSEDANLRKVWERAERTISDNDPDAELRFRSFLEEDGYLVR